MKSKASQSQGMLLFKLSVQQQSFAIGTLKVREIVPYMQTTQIPHSHQHVIGTVTIRNLTVPLIDMAAAIGFRPIPKEEYDQCYLIVTDCLRTVVAFMVRTIEKIIDCDWHSIEPSPPTAGRNAFVTGITRYDDTIVQMLDVELLLSKIYPQDASARIPILTDVEREQLKPLNILLVDDSFVARKQLSDALDGINISYTVCKNGMDALESMRNFASEGKPVDLLVSDIEMPGLDGYELVFEVQNDERLRGAYRILHTSLSSQMSSGKAQQVGAHEALTKFDATELIRAMLRGAEMLEKNAIAS
jgi:two-component system chemotaxis response regulator CheV